MNWIISIIASLASTKSGQESLSWLVSLIWSKLKLEAKVLIAKEEINKIVKENIDEYEKILLNQSKIPVENLSEDEKNALRKIKVKIQTSIFNDRP